MEQPAKTFQNENIRASILYKEIMDKNGQKKLIPEILLQKAGRHNTNYNKNDLPKVVEVMSNAYNYLAFVD